MSEVRLAVVVKTAQYHVSANLEESPMLAGCVHCTREICPKLMSRLAMSRVEIVRNNAITIEEVFVEDVRYSLDRYMVVAVDTLFWCVNLLIGVSRGGRILLLNKVIQSHLGSTTVCGTVT